MKTTAEPLDTLPAVETSAGSAENVTEAREPHAASPHIEVRYLTPSELGIWDALVDASPQGSAFSRTWWLKAVGGKVRLLGYFKDGRLLGGVPLYFEKRFGMTLCTMPKLTQTLGPILAPLNGRHVNAEWEEAEILTDLAKALAEQPVFFQAFHPSLQNWCPFYWKGFKQTSRLTNILDLRDLDQVWAGMAHRVRRAVRSAERAGLKVIECEPEAVWYAEEKTFAQQNMKVPHSIDYLRRLHRAAKEQGAGACFAAVDELQRVHAAMFLIWDPKRTYAVALGSDPEFRLRGSAALLVWRTVEFAARHSPVYDFAGSMLQPVELFLRSFGTTRIPYSWIMKFPLWLQIYLTCRGKL